eukprot:GDKJ01020188.1.p1 GENE.GDKJ01020188.1~~GDKJ01020188.1.p1  ORF type:complete len:271 (+),score=7.96 GDKJ01020188.1:128-940(+)
MKTFVVFILSTLTTACDLIPDANALKRSFILDRIDADNDPCLQAENCLHGPGQRVVLRFDSHVKNIGYSDCTIGWTPRCPLGDDSNIVPQFPFTYDRCHKHWHFTGFSDYFLYDQAGNLVNTGQKNGLCLMDVVCTGGRKKFTCQNQGISPGCTDIYNKALDCQWIDVTDMPGGYNEGVYEFRWKTNAGRLISETNFDNNDAVVTIDLSQIPWKSVREAAAPNQCPLAGGRPQPFRRTTGGDAFDWGHYRSLDSGSERRAYRRSCRNGNC